MATFLLYQKEGGRAIPLSAKADSPLALTFMGEVIKIHKETKKQLDILRGAGATLTYDAIIQALIQAQRMLRLLGQDETRIYRHNPDTTNWQQEE